MKEMIYKEPELEELKFENIMLCTSPLSDDQQTEDFEGEYNI